FVADGATLDVTLKARVLSNGVPINGRTVSYLIVAGSGTLNSATAKTDSNGYATNTLKLTSVASDVQVSTCVEPGSNPCKTFYITSVPATILRMEAVSGGTQIIPVGGGFQPVLVRITDNGTPPDPVQGVAVVFSTITTRPDPEDPFYWLGEAGSGG